MPGYVPLVTDLIGSVRSANVLLKVCFMTFVAALSSWLLCVLLKRIKLVLKALVQLLLQSIRCGVFLSVAFL